MTDRKAVSTRTSKWATDLRRDRVTRSSRGRRTPRGSGDHHPMGSAPWSPMPIGKTPTEYASKRVAMPRSAPTPIRSSPGGTRSSAKSQAVGGGGVGTGGSGPGAGDVRPDLVGRLGTVGLGEPLEEP